MPDLPDRLAKLRLLREDAGRKVEGAKAEEAGLAARRAAGEVVTEGESLRVAIALARLSAVADTFQRACEVMGADEDTGQRGKTDAYDR